MCLSCKLTAERKRKREDIYPSCWKIVLPLGDMQLCTHSLMCTHCHQCSDSPLFSHILCRILLESYHMGVDKIGGPTVILTVRYAVYLQKPRIPFSTTQSKPSLHLKVSLEPMHTYCTNLYLPYSRKIWWELYLAKWPPKEILAEFKFGDWHSRIQIFITSSCVRTVEVHTWFD